MEQSSLQNFLGSPMLFFKVHWSVLCSLAQSAAIVDFYIAIWNALIGVRFSIQLITSFGSKLT